MIAGIIGRTTPTRDERSRAAAHVDRVIHLLGFGQSLNKFETQRMLWGWVTPSYGTGVIVPAYVRIELFDSETQASYRDDDGRTLPEPDGVADWIAREEPSRSEERNRHQVGHAILHGEGGGYEGTPAERQKGMTPFLDVRMQLTRREWSPVRECLEISRWRDGRGPTLSVRIELPDDLDREALLLEPWGYTFAITRYWMESVAVLGAGLDAHPLFKSSIASGGIGELF